MRKIFILLATCIVFSFADSTQSTTVNIWNKVSSDELNPGRIVSLDMSHGYSIADQQYIYIIAFEVGTGDTIVTAFPNGGYWVSPEPDPFLQALQEEFDSLEDYLKSRESKEIRKK